MPQKSNLIMYDVLKMGKKTFTVSVVVATIVWSIGLAALLVPLAASAATISSGDLIKGSLPAVYYYGADGKRYVFPNEKTYKTWYTDFSTVKTVTNAELAAITIGGNVTYKPGVKMVKITTDPKVYAVDAGGALRWVNSENIAALLYGGSWATYVEDVPDAFFVNYTTGEDVATTTDFVKATVTAAATSINVDKGLASAAGGVGTLTIATDANTAAAGSVVSDANGSQQRAKMLTVKFTAGSADVTVTGLKVKRSGISKDGDVDNVLIMEDAEVLAEAQSIGSNTATFALSAGLFTVTANTSKTIDVAVNLNNSISTGSTMSWSLVSANVTSNAATVTGSALGNTMTSVLVTDLGGLDVGQTNTFPATVDPGTLAKEMWRVSFNAQSQDQLLTYAKFNNLGSSYDADIQNIKLMDGATQLNGVVAQIVDKVVEFDLSTMTGGGYKILAGTSKQLTLNGDIISGTSRNFQWSIQKQEDIRVTDLEYNVSSFVDDYDATDDDSFGVIQATADVSTAHSGYINIGTLSVGLATDSPNTYITDGGTGLTLAKYNFKASGEDVKITALTIICQASTTTRTLVNTMIKLDGVQVGTTDATMTCGSATNVANYTFGNTFILTAGTTHKVEITGDLTSSSWVADDTVYVGFGGTATAQGRTSLTALTPTNANGNILTLKGAALTAISNLSFTNRSSSQPTGVTNATNVKVGSFVVIGASGEAANISQFVLRDNATYFMGNNFQNMVLKNSSGTQIGTTISTLNTSDSTYTFTPAVTISIGKGEQQVYDVYADIKSSVTNASAVLTILEIDTVNATGAVTGSSANFGTAGNDTTDVALQSVYIAAYGNLAVDESADTATGQMLVLGATGVSFAKFKLTADAAEDITVSEFTVAQDMSSGFNLNAAQGGPHFLAARSATGSIQNLKLYNGSTLLGTVSAFDQTNNSVSAIATFSGFTLTVPKNSNVILEVKGDLTSFADGGVPSSSQRIFIPVTSRVGLEGGKQTSTSTNSVVAVGAGSGQTMSVNSLDMNGGTQTGDTDQNVVGNYMDLVRAKLTFAHASDSPKGSASVSSEQTVAKFLATNSSNIGNYSLYIHLMNFDVSSSGSSLPVAGGVDLYVYKDSVATVNQLATTAYTEAWANGTQLNRTGLTQANFTDLEIGAASSKNIIVTLETNILGFATVGETLSVGIKAGGYILDWNDDNTDRSYDYYTVDSLPLAGQTLVF